MSQTKYDLEIDYHEEVYFTEKPKDQSLNFLALLE